MAANLNPPSMFAQPKQDDKKTKGLLTPEAFSLQQTTKSLPRTKTSDSSSTSKTGTIKLPTDQHIVRSDERPAASIRKIPSYQYMQRDVNQTRYQQKNESLHHHKYHEQVNSQPPNQWSGDQISSESCISGETSRYLIDKQALQDGQSGFGIRQKHGASSCLSMGRPLSHVSQSDPIGSQPHLNEMFEPSMTRSHSHPGVYQPRTSLSQLPFHQSSPQPHMTAAQPLMNVPQPHMTKAQPHITAAQPHMNVAQPHMNVAQPHMTTSQPHMNDTQSAQMNLPQPQQYNLQPPHPQHHVPHPNLNFPHLHGSASYPNINASYPHLSIPHSHPSVKDPHAIHLQHTADLITKQAEELALLRTKSQTKESKLMEEVNDLKKKLQVKEDEMNQVVLELERKIKDGQEMIHKQLREKETKYQNELDSLQDKLSYSQREAQTAKEDHERQIKEMSDQIKNRDDEAKEKEKKLQNELKSKDEDNERLNNQVSQMKTYITTSRPSTMTVTQWEQDKQQLQQRIQDLEQACSHLKSKEEYMSIRLSSAQQIMRLQEEELHKASTNSHQPDETRAILLTKWREKVFSLLVQQQTDQATSKKEKQEQDSKIQEFQAQLDSSNRLIQQLKHSIADKDAQLQMELQNIQTKEEEMANTEQIANTLDKHLTSWENAGHEIKNKLSSHAELEHQRLSRLESAFKNLSSYDQRIQFAISRVDLLKDLFTRKEFSLKLKLKEAQIRAGPRGESWEQGTQTLTQSVEENSDTVVSLKDELAKVREERDALAARLKEEAQSMEGHLQSTLRSLESQMNEKDKKLDEQEQEIRKQIKIVADLQSELESRNEEIKDATETAAMLKKDLVKVQVRAETASDEKCVALEEKYQVELREMEKRLNDARREHAKAVVSQKQMERQLSREKERAADSLKSREGYLMQEMDHIKRKLKEAESEKALLMTTLKQEGLISKYKSYRKAAKNLQEEKQEKNLKADEIDRKDQNGNKPDLTSIIQDVQSLAAQVLQDDPGGEGLT